MSTPSEAAAGNTAIFRLAQTINEGIAKLPLTEVDAADGHIKAGLEIFLAATAGTASGAVQDIRGTFFEGQAHSGTASGHLLTAAESLRQYLVSLGMGDGGENYTQAEIVPAIDSSGQIAPQSSVPDGERRTYMRNEGFLLFTDTGHRVAEMAEQGVIPQRVDIAEITDVAWDEADNLSAAHLGAVTNHLANQLEDLTTDRNALYVSCEVTASDLAAQGGLPIHQNGFADMDFTWRFSASILNYILAEYELAGNITAKERANLTLTDYAGMIESDWFASVMEDLAITRNGQYGTFGRFPRQYRYETVKKMPPFKEVDYAFEFETDKDQPTASKSLVAARIAGSLRRYVRSKKDDSPGCPVARHTGILSTEMIASSPHAQHLIATGRIKITEVAEDKSRFTQEQTPIGANLKVLAKHLRGYEARFGRPLS